MRTALLLAALLGAAVAIPAAPAAATFCYPLPTGHCVAPCDVPNTVADVIHEVTDGAADGPRCLN